MWPLEIPSEFSRGDYGEYPDWSYVEELALHHEAEESSFPFSFVPLILGMSLARATSKPVAFLVADSTSFLKEKRSVEDDPEVSEVFA